MEIPFLSKSKDTYEHDISDLDRIKKYQSNLISTLMEGNYKHEQRRVKIQSGLLDDIQRCERFIKSVNENFNKINKQFNPFDRYEKFKHNNNGCLPEPYTITTL